MNIAVCNVHTLVADCDRQRQARRIEVQAVVLVWEEEGWTRKEEEEKECDGGIPGLTDLILHWNAFTDGLFTILHLNISIFTD
jgi:hypothetical protein